MKSRAVAKEIDSQSGRQFFLRRLLRAASCLCMLSAIPGFWPAAILFALIVTAFLIPGAGILAALIVVQLAVYSAFKRLRGFGVAFAHDDPCYQAQTINRR
jgi:hypothetical protein